MAIYEHEIKIKKAIWILEISLKKAIFRFEILISKETILSIFSKSFSKEMK